MSENITLNPLIPAPLGSVLPAQAGLEGSDLAGGDSSTGDMSEAQVGTAKVGGVSPLVVPHKKFPILLFFLIPILVIIAVIAIYVLLQARTMYQQTVPIASFAPAPNPDVSSPSPSTIDSTTDWPEYTNTKHHFTLKYPPYYEIIEDNSNNVTLGFKHDNTSNDVYTHLTISYTPQYSLNNLSKCDGITQKFPCLSISSNPSDIVVDDINSKKFDIQIGSVDSDYRIVQLSDPNIELKMDISGGGLSRTFDQILSTFKFTDCTNNQALNMKIALPKKWTCLSSLDENGLGDLSLKTDTLKVEISDGGRGPYCGDGQDPGNLCNESQFILSDRFQLTTFNYKGEDKELFGGLGKTTRDTNRWISVKYQYMEAKKLTANQKQDLLDLYNSIEFTN